MSMSRRHCARYAVRIVSVLIGALLATALVTACGGKDDYLGGGRRQTPIGGGESISLNGDSTRKDAGSDADSGFSFESDAAVEFIDSGSD